MAARRVDPKSVPASSPLGRIYAASRLGERAIVRIEHDGRGIAARDGEPAAVSLLAEGVHTLARSVKFHRPRGPMCLRGNCDGCLTRVDGAPNVMACRVRARDGVQLESQNAFPNASIDVLRVTDWFFPKQFDHHHLMVTFGTTLNRAMQVFARRMAGLGTLPAHDGPTPEVERRACDVLVVGGGVAGLAAASEIARSGARVLLVDEEQELGGTLLDDLSPLACADGSTVAGAVFARALVDAARAAGVEIRTEATAVATFDDATLLATPSHLVRVEARVRLFANGGHEGVGLFESNDLPGVFTARAAAKALAHGVLVGERIVLAGDAWPSDGLAAALESVGARVTRIGAGDVVAAQGRGAVRSARVRASGAEQTHRCDALVVAMAATPAYELVGQSGVEIEPSDAIGAFVPRVSADGSTERGDVFATGIVAGVREPVSHVRLDDPLASGGPIATSRAVGASVVAALARAKASRANGGTNAEASR